MAYQEDARRKCEGRGCPKWGVVAVFDKHGRRLGMFCKSCGHRQLIRALRAEGVKPFADLDDRR